MECLNCSKDFTPNSPKAKFCKTACRVAYSRKKPKEEKEVQTDWFYPLFNEASKTNPTTKIRVIGLLEKIKAGIIK